MSRRPLRSILLGFGALIVVAAATAFAVVTATGGTAKAKAVSKQAAGPERNYEARFGHGNELGGSFDAYRYMQRAYPAENIPLAWVANEKATFNRIATAKKVKAPTSGIVGTWQPYGPTTPTEPGVLNFSGAPYVPGSRMTAMVISPQCNSNFCRLWVGTSGGGVWRTDNPLDPKPA